MKRWIACGLAAGWVAAASAVEPPPLSGYPFMSKDVAAPAPAPRATTPGPVLATTRPITQAATPDVTKPLSSVLDAAPPAGTVVTTPATVVGSPGACVGGCPTCGPVESRWHIPRLSLGLNVGPTPCLDKLRCWFAWKPGPRVIPACTPTPYQPPLRQYFMPTPASNPTTAPAAPACGPTERVPFFGNRTLGWNRPAAGGGCKDGSCHSGACRSGRCDGCHESLCEKAVGCLTPRQFGRTQPNCWSYPGAPAVSSCAAGTCDGHTAAAVAAVPIGGGIYPGTGGGYRFASSLYVPPAQAVTVSSSYGALNSSGTGVGGAGVGGNIGAVGTGATGGGQGSGGTGR